MKLTIGIDSRDNVSEQQQYVSMVSLSSVIDTFEMRMSGKQKGTA